jgi:diguanylate cyclase (GGDEF)-like protein/PAS domain S-box-containing protein
MHSTLTCDRRVPSRASRFTLRALTAILVIGVTVLMGITSVLMLQHYADDAREAEGLVVRLQSQANALSQAESHSLAQGRLSKKLAGRADAARAELNGIIAALSQRTSSDPTALAVVQPTNAYLSAVDNELSLLGANRPSDARRAEDAQVDPSFDRLQAAVNAAVTRNAEVASRAEWLAASGSVLVILLAAGVVGLLAWWTERAAGAVERAVLARSEARFRALVQHASDVTTVVGPDGRIGYQSPSIESLAGHPAERLLGTQLSDLVHPDDAARLLAFLGEVARQHRGRTQLDWRLGRQDGGWLHVETTATNLLDDPEVGGIVLNSRDVSEREALEGQLRHQAFHDSLTDLANRALFRDRVEHALVRAKRRKEKLAVLYLDLDNFKTVNDSLGHPTGDALLAEIAACLLGCVRGGDTVARLGGDEFGILLEDATGEHAPEVVAESIGAALRAPVRVNGHNVLVSASIGISDADDTNDGVDELLRNADVAMYAAKAHGKGRAERFAPEMYTAVRERLELTADLRRALDRGELRVFYQPIVDLASGQVHEVEALVRWQHPERGLLPPAAFIPLAEETGFIVPLGRWVLEEACGQASSWQAQLADRPPIVVGVNLSGRQFSDPELIEDVARVLSETGLVRATLKLEITESVAMQDAVGAEATMRALKALGVQLAIDDFGTGYSSLQYLKRFPVDTLKIDRSFVDGLGTDGHDTAIVQSVVALATSLQLDITAEGVETAVQQAQLRLLGVQRGQGYLFARPLPSQEVEHLVFGHENVGHAQQVA